MKELILGRSMYQVSTKYEIKLPVSGPYGVIDLAADGSKVTLLLWVRIYIWPWAGWLFTEMFFFVTSAS